MRIKIFAYLLLVILLQASFIKIVNADACTDDDDGPRVTSCTECTGICGTQDCTFYTPFTSYEWGDLETGETGQFQLCTYECWDQAIEQAEGIIYWTPGGQDEDSEVVCSDNCRIVDGYNEAYLQSCLVETAENLLCNCSNPEEGGTGGEEGGGSTGTLATTLSGSIQEDTGAALSGNFCTQTTSNPLANNNFAVSTNTSYGNIGSGGAYTIATLNGVSYTVTLDLTSQNGETTYVCSCPAAVDPSNPYVCRYYNVSSSATNVNFYLQDITLSNDSWFQVFGGNYFGRNGIASNIPYSFCATDGNCQAALSVPIADSGNQNTSGFPIVNAANSGSILSTNVDDYSHAYLGLAERTNNVNSYSVSTDLNQLSYGYFINLAEDNLQDIGTGEDLEPLLSDWTSAAWWQTDETNYIRVNGNVNIDDTQGFNIASGQSLVVFVDGNLTIDDNNTGDSSYQITSVAEGGFLAFIVSGNIIITADVGYELDPAIPTVPTVSMLNSNVQGVFIADGDLTIQTLSDIGEVPPDRKFIGAGTFVGWDGVNLDRTFNDNSLGPILNNNQAIENFIYRPDLLANWPAKLKVSLSNWREVDPQLINQ